VEQQGLMELDPKLNKIAQLVVTIAGFFTTVLILLQESEIGGDVRLRAVLTLALAIGLAIRYWWVILLLDWPFRIWRTTLLLLIWCALALAAANAEDARTWAQTLAALSAFGAITEAYNTLTGQWRCGSEAFAQSLRRDHIAGGGAAGAACLTLVAASLWLEPKSLSILVGGMIVADWWRLIEMINRHRRTLEE